MVDPVAVLAVGLLVLGVVGSVVPLLPGPLASLAGVYLYWWNAGYGEPGVAFVVVATVAGVLALAADYVGGAVAARAGGAATSTAVAAAVAGVALFFVAGPLGVVAGVAGTAFAVEAARHRDLDRGVRAAAYATVGALASGVVQFVVTAGLLVGFALAVAT